MVNFDAYSHQHFQTGRDTEPSEALKFFDQVSGNHGYRDLVKIMNIANVGQITKTDRQTDRQTDRKTDRQRKRQRDRQRQTEKESERQRERQTKRDRETEGQRDRDRERQRDRETERQRDRETERDREKALFANLPLFAAFFCRSAVSLITAVTKSFNNLFALFLSTSRDLKLV